MATTQETLIISASRATDLPAFHAKWFMDRLKAGYCVWHNPFNKNQSTVVSFEQTKVFVFWSKNPVPLMPHLKEIEDKGYQFYFQYTLNDYEADHLEPRLPPLAKRLDTFKKLSERLGKHRVIWRFDPIILGDSISVESILERINHLGEALHPYTEKLVFSYVDMYRKTQGSLNRIDPSLRAPTPLEMRQLAQGIKDMNESWGTPLHLATCAEEIDLTDLGILKNKCVDDELVLRLCPNDPDLEALFHKKPKQQTQLSLFMDTTPSTTKDTGQRKPCGCVKSKDRKSVV